MSENSEAGGQTENTENTRKLAKYTLARVENWQDLNAETGQKGDEIFLQKTKELWQDFAVHGIIAKDKKTGRPFVSGYSDLDGESSLALMQLAGINTAKVDCIKPGDFLEGKINIDTGGIEGVVYDQEGNTLIIDHHGETSGKESSAAKHVYKSLTDLGLLQKTEPLDRFVEFVTQSDNKTFPGYDYRQSYQTMQGLDRFVKPDKLLDFCTEGRDPASVLSKEDLDKYGLKDASEKRKTIVERTPDEFKKMEEEGFVVDSERYGKIAVVVEGESVLSGGSDAAVACGCDSYVTFSPKEDTFFVSSVRDIPENDFFYGQKLRGTMWIDERMKDYPPVVKLSLDSILLQMTDGKFEPKGKLEEYLDRESGKPPIATPEASETPPEVPPYNSLNPEPENGTIPVMAEKEPTPAVVPLTPEQQITEFLALPGLDNTLKGWANMAHNPVYWNNLPRLEGILNNGTTWAMSHPEAMDNWLALAAAIGLRTEELKASQSAVLAQPVATDAAGEIAKLFREQTERGEKRAEEARIKAEQEKERQVKIEKVVTSADSTIKTAQEAVNTAQQALNVATEIGDLTLISEATNALNAANEARGKAEQVKSDARNGDLAGAEQRGKEANSETETARIKVNEVKGRAEVAKEVAKKDLDSKKKIEGAEKTKAEIVKLNTEITRFSDGAMGVIQEALDMANEDKVIHRVKGITEIKGAIELIKLGSLALPSRIAEIDKRIRDFNAILVGQVEDRLKKANEVNGIAEGILKTAEKLINEQKGNLDKAKAVLEEGRKRRRDEVDGVFDFPKEKQHQQAFVRRQLRAIEQTGTETNKGANERKYNTLVKLRSEMDPQLAKEVEVRMRIHDAAVVITKAGGSLKNIGANAAELQNRKTPENIAGGLTRETIEETLIKKLPGLEIGKAWDLIQDANFDYKNTVNQARQVLETKITAGGLTPSEITELNGQIGILTSGDIEITVDRKEKGERDKNYETDVGNEPRRRLVREYLLNQLGLLDDDDKKQSMAIAEKLVIGTLESAVFNAGEPIGSSQLGICIGFDMWRKRRTGRARGPEITIDAIKGFSTSWLRYRYLYDSDKSDTNPGLADPSKAERDKPFKVAQIKEISDGLDKLTWGGLYCLTLLGRVDDLRELFLRTDFKPGEVSVTFLKDKVIKAIKESDPPLKIVLPDGTKTETKNGKLRLRNIFVAGILDCALETDPDLGWAIPDFDKSRGDFSNLYDTLVLTPLVVTKGIVEEGPFIEDKHWREIKDVINFNERLTALEKYRRSKKRPGGPGGRIASGVLSRIFK